MRSIGQIIGDYDNPNSLGSKFRRRRSAPLRRMIEAVYAETGAVRILDVGGMEYYWDMLGADYLAQHKVSIDLLNLKDDIRPVKNPEFFRAIEGNGCELPFPDNAYDICHSNSVIEHVGNWHNKLSFARETTRVAPRYFHQTPNFWFPWEPHQSMAFFHWLPAPMQLWIARHHRLGWANSKAQTVTDGMWAVEHASMLDRTMVDSLFPNAKIIVEHFVGLPKSFVAIST
ncbi:methyltransferase domain-containing protein [Rhodopseudomonas palustris]|uniref:methyltransferase domain-containing protein n=1 Tax=Rhodopseudomonas palustris TaxID=1076 RepID=UPI000D1B688A|nr:methyltransferase domain-containing protein [Rhodopseudomonas palustris]AVT80746.1 hypothetical protein RPYSC3_18840 [Rhodopseudomonas palustris]